MTDRIPNKFAVNGDNDPIDLTNAEGFINWDQGYGFDYERRIGTDPNAKAVERQKMNYLMGLITDNLRQWQDQGLPEWRGAAAGTTGITYVINAAVRYSIDGKVYRALQAVPVDIAPTNATYWEEVKDLTYLTSLVPMPSGAGTPANELITVPTDVNTLLNGTWEFADAASTSANLPEAVGGMLEAKTWVAAGSTNNTIQRYCSKNSNIWIRVQTASWSAWIRLAGIQEIPAPIKFPTNAAANFDATNANTYYLNAASFTSSTGTKPTPATAGLLEVRNNAGQVYQSFTDISGVKFERTKNGAAAFTAWTLLGVTAPKFDVTTKLATTAFVQAALGNAADTVLLSANTTLTAAQAGIVFGIGTANISVTLPDLTLVPNGATYTVKNLSNGIATMLPPAGGTFYISDQTVTSLILASGESATFVGAATIYGVLLDGVNGNRRGAESRNGIFSILPSTAGMMYYLPTANTEVTLPNITSLKPGDSFLFQSTLGPSKIKSLASNLFFGVGAVTNSLTIHTGEWLEVTVISATMFLCRGPGVDTGVFLVGAPIPWPSATVPDGYLIMNGQSFSAANFPKLAIAYPALVIPDLRGEFIRGWDNSRGVDPSRAILSFQLDGILNHSHNGTGFDRNSVGGNYTLTNEQFPVLGKGFLESAPPYNVTDSNNGFNNATGYVKTLHNGAIDPNKVANENRPRNVAFNYIVRAV